MITLAQALATNTDDENLAAFIAALNALGTDVAGFSPYSVSAGLPSVVARGRTREQSIRATVVRAGLGDFANAVPDEWVDILARAWWSVERIPATKARHLWPLTASAAGAIGPVAAGGLIADGGTSLFQNVAAVSLAAGETRLFEFEARTPGTAGNIAPGAVAGFQVGKAGLSIASPAGSLLFAGRPKETNAELVRKGRARFPSMSVAGNALAFDLWIPTAAPSVTRWAVDDTNPNGPGSTDIYHANAAGPATLPELALLNAYLLPKRGKGTGPLRNLPAPEQTLSFGLVIRATSVTGVAIAAAAALQNLEATIPLGGGPASVLQLDTLREPLLAIPSVYQLLFAGIGETTQITARAVLELAATIEVIP